MGAIVAAVSPDLHIAEETLRVAGLVAHEAHDRLIAVQVRAPLNNSNDTDMVYWETAPNLVAASTAEHWKAAQRSLSAEALRLLPAGVEYDVQIRTGDFVSELDNAAAEAGARLIVAGGPRPRGTGLIRESSSALRLLRRTRRPVLFVPRHEREHEPAQHERGEPTTQPAQTTGSRVLLGRVLIPVDGSDYSRPALVTLLHVARPGITEIRIVYVRAHDVTRGPTTRETPAEAAAALSRVLAELRRAEFSATGEVIDAAVGQIADAIVLQAQRDAATLVVLGIPADRIARRSRTRLAERVLARATCPVLAAR